MLAYLYTNTKKIKPCIWLKLEHSNYYTNKKKRTDQVSIQMRGPPLTGLCPRWPTMHHHVCYRYCVFFPLVACFVCLVSCVSVWMPVLGQIVMVFCVLLFVFGFLALWCCVWLCPCVCVTRRIFSGVHISVPISCTFPFLL